ncbi:MAG: galactose-1-phosphate uridylyltransferase, partial [Deltaproteobacteria bacterium]|nr:galactose-1-phosphate uridylyltransferase [Deltaproteobacteria bacterium]
MFSRAASTRISAPELRRDPIVDRWVIISEERGDRPIGDPRNPGSTASALCPFCPGNEAETLPEIAAVRAPNSEPDSPGWRVRTVPNKYPALRPDAAPRDARGPLFRRQPAAGHHEVIVEGDAHTRSVSELQTDTMREVVGMYRDRLQSLAQINGLRSAVIIKNVGESAGASLEHSHSQLIATPVVPPLLASELDANRAASAELGKCAWCAVIREEQSQGERVVAVGEFLVAVCPWASRFPYETWILPLAHESHYEATSDDVLDELARFLPRIVSAIEVALSRPPYNYVIQSAPFPIESLDFYHWSLAVFPRVTRVAGYEQATGLYINPVAPESAAAKLRA